ncbi:MAG: glycosyltransferase family 2 protein [Chlamydiae bacterium]|nr:glycosyltransferase family 2 protein [Chlamydiota bacterium]MBI3266509.1 glycosyltransferase family 2 protein [Chlamydiota bacterium]
MTESLRLAICIPTYNGAPWMGETLQSIFNQSFKNFEIIVSDDNSKDATLDVIRAVKDSRIKIIHKNKENLGCGRNLQRLRELAGENYDILFFMSQDDILLKGALEKTYHAFLQDSQIGVVTRPYYWFDEDVLKPVRAVTPYDERRDAVISILDGPRVVKKVFESVGQVSGLAYRIKYLDTVFHDEIFPTHIYPFASICKKYKIVFLKDYTVAVRISSSQTRFKSSIYEISPTASWVKMFETVFADASYKEVKRVGIEQIATHYEGLIQIKNYSTFKILIREIFFLLRYRWLNVFSPKFLFFSLGVLVIPRRILIKMVEEYKNRVLARRLKGTGVPLFNT